MLMGPDGKPLPPAASGLAGQAVMRVAREETANLQVGQVVIYHILGPVPQLQFHIIASRMGVELMGQLPAVNPKGLSEVARLMRRQARQHEALAKTPVGEKQVMLTEAELDMLDAPRHFGPLNRDTAPASAGAPSNGKGV